MPAIITITTEGENTLKFTWPVGVMNNPADLVIGENSVTLAAGSQGYYYTWTATANGTLTVTITGENWFYVINNLTTSVYGDNQWSDSDPVVNPAVITVAAGDEIQIVVNTYDPANEWNAPAGTIAFTAAFEEEQKVPECETHSYMTDYVNNPARFNKTWGICTVCGYIDENHEHSVKDGKCVYCDYTFETTPVASTFSNDGDETPDVFYFSAALPEEFTGADAIFLDAYNASTGSHMTWDQVKANEGNPPCPYPHVYNSDAVATESIAFTVNVKKAGLYNVAVHYRIKDNTLRGATYIVNEGTDYEQSIPHTYSWPTKDEALETRNNDLLIGVYMTGLVFALQEGDNTITIRVAEGVEKSQHIRDLRLVWSADLPKVECETHSYMTDYVNNPARFNKTWGICTVCGYIDENHEHSVKDGKCVYCDYTFETTPVASTFSNDGDETPDVFYFSAALPEEFTGADAIFLDAYNASTGSHMTWDQVKANEGNPPCPYPHVYNSDAVATESIAFTVNVKKAGLYNVAVHYRIKDNTLRGATYIVNEGTDYEQSIPHTYSWPTKDEALETRNNDLLIGVYMTGLVFALQEGDNTITIRVAEGVEKSQHIRDLRLVWSADLPEVEEPETPVEPEEPEYATLTAEEAIAKGITFEKTDVNAGKYYLTEEFYYVTLTLNTNANANGFARATLEGKDMIISVAAPAGYVEGTYELGDTVTFLAQVGCVNSATTSTQKEARLFNATVVEVVKAPVEETPAA